MIQAKTRGRSFKAARPGVTLVELLVVVLIVLIVLAVACTLYRISLTSYAQENTRLEQDHNLRLAMVTVARDVRMAGNGFRIMGLSNTDSIQAYDWSKDGWFKHPAFTDEGARAISGEDGGTDAPDSLTIFRSEAEAGAPLGYLKGPYKYTGPLVLTGVSFEEDKIPLRHCDILALVDAEAAKPRVALAQAGVPDSKCEERGQNSKRGEKLGVSGSGDNLMIPIIYQGLFTPPEEELPPVFSPDGVPSGSAVYNLRNVVLVTYRLMKEEEYLKGNAPDQRNTLLLADYHDGSEPVLVASNIHDFQVRDLINLAPLDDLNETPELGFKSGQAKAAALGFTACSRETRDTPARNLPDLFNRTGGKWDKNEPRVCNTLIETTINLRNF